MPAWEYGVNGQGCCCRFGTEVVSISKDLRDRSGLPKVKSNNRLGTDLFKHDSYNVELAHLVCIGCLAGRFFPHHWPLVFSLQPVSIHDLTNPILGTSGLHVSCPIAQPVTKLVTVSQTRLFGFMLAYDCLRSDETRAVLMRNARR